MQKLGSHGCTTKCIISATFPIKFNQVHSANSVFQWKQLQDLERLFGMLIDWWLMENSWLIHSTGGEWCGQSLGTYSQMLIHNRLNIVGLIVDQWLIQMWLTTVPLPAIPTFARRQPFIASKLQWNNSDLINLDYRRILQKEKNDFNQDKYFWNRYTICTKVLILFNSTWEALFVKWTILYFILSSILQICHSNW